jgi:two-component system cell cycle sensor histidine kinase/response regulator CckA
VSTPIRLLLVEDNEDDAELILSMLRRRGHKTEALRVDTLAAIQNALGDGVWDCVLSDFSLPTCNGLDVLRTVRERDPDVPFLFVSGSIGEEVAVAAMRAGAHDYILKDNLTRLEPAVARELKDAVERREHRHMAQRLRRVETQLRRVFESRMIGMVFWRKDGVALEANEEFLRLTGFSAEDLREGRLNWRAMVPAEHVELHEGSRREDDAPGMSAPAEIEIRTRQGAPRQVLVASVTLDASAQEGASFVLDMTKTSADREARRVLEDQLRQAQKMELVARLAGGVAHDFNNLLAVVILSADLAREEVPMTTHALLDDITQAAVDGAALTRQLLALGRRQALVPHRVDVNELVRGQESLLRRLGGESVLLRMDLSPNLGLVNVDSTQMEQVLLNLCVNARDAMPDGGHLTIQTSPIDLTESVYAIHGVIPPGAYVMITVADTGIGMDRPTLNRIFEPFFSTKGLGKGTGLGLAVVHGIVSQSHGHVAVFSEPGIGTTFRVYLPRMTGETKRAVVGPVAVAPRARNGELVLIAEDEQTLRRAATQALQRSGYNVLAAADGAEALFLSRRHKERIHLLISDVVMPGLSGPQLYDQLRRDRPDLRVLFTSGYLPDNLSRQSTLALEGRFLLKPFTMGDLARKVRDIIDAPLIQTH